MEGRQSTHLLLELGFQLVDSPITLNIIGRYQCNRVQMLVVRNPYYFWHTFWGETTPLFRHKCVYMVAMPTRKWHLFIRPVESPVEKYILLGWMH